MGRSIFNSIQLQNFFYNLMAVLLVGGIIALIVLEFAIEMQEVGLAFFYSFLVLGLFWHLYNIN